MSILKNIKFQFWKYRIVIILVNIEFWPVKGRYHSLTWEELFGFWGCRNSTDYERWNPGSQRDWSDIWPRKGSWDSILTFVCSSCRSRWTRLISIRPYIYNLRYSFLWIESFRLPWKIKSRVSLVLKVPIHLISTLIKSHVT